MRTLARTLLLLGVLALLLAVTYIPLLEAVARFLIVADPLERADVIIVLAGGRRDERVRQGAELYRQGFAPLVLLSGGEEMMGISLPELLGRQARAHGVPAEALLYEPGSTSTGEQARLLRPMLEARGMRRAIIVTSTYHTRRTRYIFRTTFAGTGIDLRVYPVQQDLFSPENWWTRDPDTESVVLEYIKLALAVLR